MTLAQSLFAIIVFWAIIGGIGASLLLPAMQSLIHGNFEGTAQKQVYASSDRRPRSRRQSGLCWAALLPPTSPGESASSRRL
jgi:hypothetical protein